jgi:hypothetical protein
VPVRRAPTALASVTVLLGGVASLKTKLTDAVSVIATASATAE